MTDHEQSSDELRHRMADYLGDEIDAAQRQSFEAALARDAELAAEVESLKGALRAMRSIDDAGSPPAPAPLAPAPLATITPARRGARLMRVAALLALAFIGGYVVKGMEPTPGVAQRPEVAELPPPKPSAAATDDGIGPLFAQNYISESDRRGLGRSLIAYGRARIQQRKD